MADETPIDIEGLLSRMEAYIKGLEECLGRNEHPGVFIFQSQERYIDWMLANNGVPKFKTTNDFVEFLYQKKKELSSNDEPFSLLAFVSARRRAS